MSSLVAAQQQKLAGLMDEEVEEDGAGKGLVGSRVDFWESVAVQNRPASPRRTGPRLLHHRAFSADPDSDSEELIPVETCIDERRYWHKERDRWHEAEHWRSWRLLEYGTEQACATHVLNPLSVRPATFERSQGSAVFGFGVWALKFRAYGFGV
ncbi:unnamed protein product [Symbiodinium sp. CCMP2456]|nr:unnamed protein product [Symbiodinium sp. CCMP2456]